MRFLYLLLSALFACIPAMIWFKALEDTYGIPTYLSAFVLVVIVGAIIDLMWLVDKKRRDKEK